MAELERRMHLYPAARTSHADIAVVGSGLDSRMDAALVGNIVRVLLSLRVVWRRMMRRGMLHVRRMLSVMRSRIRVLRSWMIRRSVRRDSVLRSIKRIRTFLLAGKELKESYDDEDRSDKHEYRHLLDACAVQAHYQRHQNHSSSDYDIYLRRDRNRTVCHIHTSFLKNMLMIKMIYLIKYSIK